MKEHTNWANHANSDHQDAKKIKLLFISLNVTKLDNWKGMRALQ